jgi:hypothetical protein
MSLFSAEEALPELAASLARASLFSPFYQSDVSPFLSLECMFDSTF